MARVVLLDAGTLGMVAHPKANLEVATWLLNLLAAGTSVKVPEISDYEVRRNLILEKKDRSIQRLNELASDIGYEPLSTEAMRVAAQLWADARRKGLPTADKHALDADVILGAQATILQRQGFHSVVATDNVGHLGRYTEARRWSDIRA